jgi:hypothetical protein
MVEKGSILGHIFSDELAPDLALAFCRRCLEERLAEPHAKYEASTCLNGPGA